MSQEQEITLQSVGSLFNSVIRLFFRCVHKALSLIKRFFIIFIILIIGGAILGYLKDQNKTFDNVILVKSNFGSVDYLYNKIEFLDARIKQNDVEFLTQTVGLKNPSALRSIKSEPIKEVFDLTKIDAVNNYSRNYDVLKLLSDNSDITKVMEDEPVKRMFQNQRITIEASEFISYEESIVPILNFLNSSDYFAKMQKVYTEGQQFKIEQTEALIQQIDEVLGSFAANSENQKSGQLFMYGGDSQLNDLALTKAYQLETLNNLKADLLNYDKIIKEKNHSLNIGQASFLKGKMKFLYPFALFVVFLGFLFFVEGYKKYTSDLKN
jgi:hypothetical protein